MNKRKLWVEIDDWAAIIFVLMSFWQFVQGDTLEAIFFALWAIFSQLPPRK